MRIFLLAVAIIALSFSFVLQAFAQSNQTVTNGGSTTAVNFTGSGCTYNWVNKNPAIGLAASGTGDIYSFTAVNTGSTAITATITGTPVPAQNAYITNAGANTISVIDVTTHALVTTIPVGQAPEWASVTPDGSKVYIANHNSDNVSVINALTNTVIATIPVGPNPICIALNSDATLAYVSNSNFHEFSGSVSVIDTKTNTVINTFSIQDNPNDIALSKDGTKLYVVEAGEVAVLDALTGNILANIGVGINTLNAISMVISPDGQHVYVTSNSLNNNDGYVSVINTATNTIEANIQTDNTDLFGINISPDGQTLYVTSSGGNNNTNDIFVINTTTNTVSATITDGVDSPVGICFTPNGKQAYVINYFNSEILDINTVDNTVIAHIPLGAYSYPNCSGNFISPALSCSSSPVSFTITVYPQGAVPTITASPATGNITSCVGTASASPNIQQFTVSGSNLSAPVTATAPIGFEVSLTSGSGYGNSVTLNQTAGNLNSSTVYVRSAANDPDGPLSGNVTLSTTGAANQNVLVSGVVNALPTVSTIPNQTVYSGSATTAVNFTGTGNTFTWTNDTPGIGLPASGTGNISPFTALNTGTSPVTATITVSPASAGYMYMANTANNTLEVINTFTNAIVATIPTQKYPVGVSVSPDKTRVYVSDENPGGQSSVSVISTSTNSVIATIPIGVGAWGIVTSPDGKWVYVANETSGTVSVINTATNTLYIDIPIPAGAVGIAISPDGSRVYVAASYNTDCYVVVINTVTNTVLKNIPLTGSLWGITVSPDGSKVYAANPGNNTVAVINTSNNTVTANITVGNFPDGIVTSPDGSRIYVTNNYGDAISVIDAGTNTVINTIGDGQNPEGVSITPDGKDLYVVNTNSNTINVFDTQTNALINTISIGQSGDSQTLGNFLIAGTGCSGASTTFTITVNPAATIPTITAGRVTGDIVGCYGSVSDVRQFTVSASGLTAGITATAPADFEISLSPTSGFGSTLTVPQTNGTVNNTIIYVRTTAAAYAGNQYQNVDLASKGATTQEVIVSYTIYAIPSADAVISQTITNGSATSPINFNGTASTYNWVNDTPGIGLAASGTGNITTFTAINNTANPITATITATPVNGLDCSGTPIIFTITVNPTPQPTTLTASANLTPLTTIYGTPSSAESFTISGTNISGGILVTPPPGFEVSTNETTFNTTATINSTGTISNAPVYIRLAATTPVGLYSGNIVLNVNNSGLTPKGPVNSTASINVFMPASTVTPAPLTITADNITKPFGAVNPPLTITYSGFVNNDGAAQLTSQPVISTTALTQSPIGQYPITVSDAASPNYNVTYVAGILTIQPSISTLDIPNTFTPNGDGINDTWQIKYLEYYPRSTVNIFDRWGQKVFSSIGYPIPWDGTYNGRVLPVGTYYYIIDPKTGQGVFSGWLALIR